jgi:hypothetical protein
VRTHRGVVLAMGPPARTSGGVEVEPGFAPGDVIQFHFEHHQETATNMWTDGKPATWLPQSSVDAVWEAERDTLRSGVDMATGTDYSVHVLTKDGHVLSVERVGGEVELTSDDVAVREGWDGPDPEDEEAAS